MEKTIEVSVVIPFYYKNDTNDLLKCVRALAQQTCIGDEIVVVANGREDFKLDGNVLAALDDCCVQVIYLIDSAATSYMARNMSFHYTKNPIIAFLDDDVIPKMNYLQEVKDFFSHYQDVVMMGGTVKFSEKEIKTSFITANVAIAAWLFALHKFENVSSGGDLKLAKKIESLGYNVGLNPRAIVVHKEESLWMRTRKTLRYGSGTTTKKLWASLKELSLSGWFLLVKTIGFIYFKVFNKVAGKL